MNTEPAQHHNPEHSNTMEHDEISALSLQLEELREHKDTGKGKYKAGHPPDFELAMCVFQEDVQRHLLFLNDLRCAHSIARAVDTDAHAIASVVQDEIIAQEDRRLALQMSNGNREQGNVSQFAEIASPTGFAMNQDTGDEQAAIYDYELHGQYFKDALDDSVSGDEEYLQRSVEHIILTSVQSGPSMSYTERQKKGLDKLLEHTYCCVACMTNFQAYKIVHLDCKHTYCTDCLKRLFSASVKDEGLFPPRCCRQDIPIEHVAPTLSPEEMESFQAAKIEFSVKNRTYCSNLDCAKFIPPGQIVADRATCSNCSEATCTHCKGTFHTGECPEDHDMENTLALAEEEGWRRCHSCRAMVELTYGCNHMDCKCGAQFCYLCGMPWKQCGCAVWDERRLLARAEQVVDREAPNPLPVVERTNRINLMRRELLEQHECNHPGRFERVFGGGKRGFTCEMCNVRHRKYILRCRRCHLDVCEDCRRNRVR